MKIKKLSRFKKWLAIASSTAVASSLLLMFAGLNVSKANEVKQLNNIQNQTLQNRSVQPKAAGAIEGDYLLDSNNAIPVRDENGTVTNNNYTAMRSDGIGIGPKGYLLHNNSTGKWDYVGYDGQIIWTTTVRAGDPASDAGWSIKIDYDETTNTFITFTKEFSEGSSSAVLGIRIFNADNGNNIYSTTIDNSYLISNNFQNMTITKIQNYNENNSFGYYIFPGHEDIFNNLYAWNLFFGLGSKPSSAPNSTSFASDFSGGWYSEKKFQIQKNASDPGRGRYVKVAAFFKNNNFYTVLAKRYTNGYVHFNAYKNDIEVKSYNSWNYVVDWFSNWEQSNRNAAYYFWQSGSGVNIEFLWNISNNEHWIYHIEFNFNDNSLTNPKKITLDGGDGSIDFDTYNSIIYNNTLYAYGNNYTSKNNYDSVMILNLAPSNINTIADSNNRLIFNSSTGKVFKLPISALGENHTKRSIGIFPTYSSSNRPFTNTNINIIGINRYYQQKGIVTVTPDGNFAYNTNFINLNEIDISSNEILKNMTSMVATRDQIISELKKDDYALLKKSFSRFRNDTDITMENVYTNFDSNEAQNLYARGEWAVNMTINRAYGNNNGLTSTCASRTFNNVIIKGFKPIPNTLAIDQDSNIAGNQVNIANVSLGSNQVNTIAPSNVNEAQLKTWMQNNWQQYLDENTVPRSFSNTNIQNITIANKDDSTGTVKVQFQLIGSFKNSTYTTDPQTFEISFKGFKQILNLDTNVNNAVETSGIAASGVLDSSKAPYEVISNKTLIQSFIITNQTKIFDNLPSTLNINNTTIVDVIIKNSTMITVKVTIPASYNSSVINKEFSFDITGFTNKETSIIKSSIAASQAGWASLSANDITTQQVKNYIWQNKNNFIKNPINSLTQSDIDILEVDDGRNPVNGEAIFKLRIKKYIGANGLETTNPALEKYITITGLNTSSIITATTLNISNIKYTDSLFKNVYNGYSLYYCDWSENKYTNSSLTLDPLSDIKNYLNNNTSQFFSNLPSDLSNPVTSVEFGNKSLNMITLIVKFNGYIGNGNAIDIITQNITLTLKPTPSFNQLISSSEINSKAFNNWLKEQDQSWPTDKVAAASKFEQFIKTVVTNKSWTPGQDIPNIFYPIKVNVDDNKISINNDGNIVLANEAITISANNNSNKITSLGIIIENQSTSSDLDGGPVLRLNDVPNWFWTVIIACTALVLILLIVLFAMYAKHYKNKDTKSTSDGTWY